MQIVSFLIGCYGQQTVNGGARRDRTDDLKLAKLPLSQLSYGPKILDHQTSKELVGRGRFELPTSRLSVVRSNQLSYRPNSLTGQQRPNTAKRRCGEWCTSEKKEKRRRRLPQFWKDRDLVQPYVS